MNVYNNGYIPYNPYNAYVQTALPAVQYRAYPINLGPTQDVFQRSIEGQAAMTPLGQNAPVQASGNVAATGVWNSKRVEEIYNKTYDIVMAQNPITKELNIQKPPLDFGGNKDGALASYICGTNKIKIQDRSFFEGNLYLCNIKDKNGETVDIKVLGQKSSDDIQAKHPEYTITKEKLNDSEKELYISSVFAHELRHCIQTHLLCSTKGCMEEYKTYFTELKGALEELVEAKKEMAALEGKPYVQGEEDLDLQSLNYGLNYKPKKVFDENALFKFSMLPKDNRYWSIKEHLLSKSEQSKKNGEYYNNPLEIDAYNYEYEFLATQMKNYPKGAVREDIANNLSLAVCLNVEDEGVNFKRF